MDPNYTALLQQLASVPGLQDRLKAMHGLNQGIPVMKSGGQDAAWSAALAHQGVGPGDVPQEILIDLYNRIGNPQQRAAEERANMMQQMQRLFGMSQLPGPRAYIAPPLQ